MVVKAFLFFGVPLVADRNVSTGQAIAVSVSTFLKNARGVIGLILIQTLMVIGGILLCGVGLLLIAPLVYATEAIAYRRVFGLATHEPETVG